MYASLDLSIFMCSDEMVIVMVFKDHIEILLNFGIFRFWVAFLFEGVSSLKFFRIEFL